MTILKNNVKNKYFHFMLLFIAFTITAFAVITGVYIRDSHSFELDSVSLEKIKAPRTMENRGATLKNRLAAQEAAATMDPITERDPSVSEQLKSDLDSFFEEAASLREQNSVEITPESYENPVRPTKIKSLSESSTALLLKMDDDRYERFVADIYSAAEKIMGKAILRLDSKSLSQVKDEMDKLDLNSDSRTLGYDIIITFLKPNIFINQEATDKARANREASYETIYYLKDQTIVDEGQIIDENIYMALTDLGYTKTNYLEGIVQISGTLILILTIFALIVAYIRFFNPSIIQNRNESVLLFALYLMILLIVRLAISLPYQFVPIYVFTLLIAMLLDVKLASVCNIGLTLICLLIYRGDVDFMMYHLLSGFAIALISQYTTDRNKIIIAAFLSSLVNMFIYAGVFFLIEKQYSQLLLYNAMYAAASGMFGVVLCYGSMPIWEAGFAVVTPVKLLDLTNPDSGLLRRLAIESPGTYHHCIIVANLAETAAYDIKANSNLARAGGYYHDIGKLKYPQYFSENIVGENPHDDMDPYSSIQVIKSHITYGLELADKHKLPKVVRDIIYQHHGCTLLKFFYYKAVKSAGDGVIDEEDFRYNCSVPLSREAAVIMLADTVEAAVRSMIPSGKTMDEVQTFVGELIKDKLDDGQLIESTLTIKDLDTIVHSFMRVFKGMYHERIPYPKIEKEKVENSEEDNQPKG